MVEMCPSGQMELTWIMLTTVTLTKMLVVKPIEKKPLGKANPAPLVEVARLVIEDTDPEELEGMPGGNRGRVEEDAAWTKQVSKLRYPGV